MERIVLPVLMLLALVVVSQGAQITVYRIHLNADGSALWTIEHKYPLGEKTFCELFERANNNLGSLAESYKNRLESIASKISSQLRRPMSIENLIVTAKVTDTLTGSVGVIRVEFVWRGFARLLEGKIEVGDVFIGGLVLLEGESLRFVLPEGMSISEISPKPDVTGAGFVEWAGRRVFSDGEPRIVLAVMQQSTPATGLQASPAVPWVFLFLILVLAITVAALLVWRRRPARPQHEVDAVLRVLQKYGGMTSQSRIVRETGLPKSAVSTILKVLEGQGIVARQKGR